MSTSEAMCAGCGREPGILAIATTMALVCGRCARKLGYDERTIARCEADKLAASGAAEARAAPIECPHGHDVRCCAYLTCATSSQIAATDYGEGP